MANLTVHRHSGYIRYEGLYRVPDLLNEEQFIEYMKNTYDVTVQFIHKEDEQELDQLLSEVDQTEADKKITTKKK